MLTSKLLINIGLPILKFKETQQSTEMNCLFKIRCLQEKVFTENGVEINHCYILQTQSSPQYLFPTKLIEAK